jgi:hypothetical protein
MADDRTKRGPHDRRCINVNQDYEVRYRKRKFGVSEQQLRQGVKRAGGSAWAVERELKTK